jgi:N-acetylglucosamine malate deacetylase 2
MPKANYARAGDDERGRSTLLGTFGLSDADAAVVIVAHPDDETIAIGGHLHEMRSPVIVHATDGAPRNMSDARRLGFASRQAYALARRAEFAAAISESGADRPILLRLGAGDQEAAAQLAGLSRGIAEILRANEPRVVFTHAYEGGHPDHDAVAFAVHAAVRLTRMGNGAAPVLIEMPLYHGEGGRMIVQKFAPTPALPVATFPLAASAARRKQRMLARYRTQRRTLAQFHARVECFRAAPNYDFTSLPNGGELYYEHCAWGLDGPAWLTSARAALDELGLSRCR